MILLRYNDVPVQVQLKQPTGMGRALLGDIWLELPGRLKAPRAEAMARAGNATCNATDSTFYALAISTLLTGAGTVAGSGIPECIAATIEYSLTMQREECVCVSKAAKRATEILCQTRAETYNTNDS